MKKLIDFYPDLLNEASAGEEAKKRGLKSIGFGRYVDPSNPSKVVAKSKNGKLVSVGQTAPSHMKGKEAERFNKRAAAFDADDDDIGGAKKQVRDIEKRNRSPNREEDQRSLNKRQGNTLRKVFGKGIRLSKVTTAGGQRQMWWNVDETGVHNAAMGRRFQQWQANKLMKIKKAIAADPELAGWQPVFQQDRHDGLHLVMAKG